MQPGRRQKPLSRSFGADQRWGKGAPATMTLNERQACRRPQERAGPTPVASGRELTCRPRSLCRSAEAYSPPRACEGGGGEGEAERAAACPRQPLPPCSDGGWRAVARPPRPTSPTAEPRPASLPALQLLDVFNVVEQLHAADLHKLLNVERGEYRSAAGGGGHDWPGHDACLPCSPVSAPCLRELVYKLVAALNACPLRTSPG